MWACRWLKSLNFSTLNKTNKHLKPARDVLWSFFPLFFQATFATCKQSHAVAIETLPLKRLRRTFFRKSISMPFIHTHTHMDTVIYIIYICINLFIKCFVINCFFAALLVFHFAFLYPFWLAIYICCCILRGVLPVIFTIYSVSTTPIIGRRLPLSLKGSHPFWLLCCIQPFMNWPFVQSFNITYL